LTEIEKIRTRIILAKSINRSPDSIDVFEADDKVFYLLNDFRSMNFAFCFEKVPTIDQAREEVKNYYLSGCEIDFDIEFTDRYEQPK